MIATATTMIPTAAAPADPAMISVLLSMLPVPVACVLVVVPSAAVPVVWSSTPGVTAVLPSGPNVVVLPSLADDVLAE